MLEGPKEGESLSVQTSSLKAGSPESIPRNNPGLTTSAVSSAARQANEPQNISNHPAYCITPGLATILPSLQEITSEISRELVSNLHILLTLNPSRRKALLVHLNQLVEPGDFSLESLNHSRSDLQNWILGPASSSQKKAIELYVQEVAIIYLSKTILLKAWSDRGIRQWQAGDLVNLNWALIRHLKNLIPLNRDGWELVKANLYSWYNPSAELREKIWNLLGVIDFKSESTAIITSLAHLRSQEGDRGYDPLFFSSLWASLWKKLRPSPDPQQPASPSGSVGLQIDRFRRKKTIFTPTLRDGRVLDAVPQEMKEDMEWIATESDPFQMILAEIRQLWERPIAPPLWLRGNGLSVNNREQLSMKWTHNPKPSNESQIQEIESCDLGFVLEERITRISDRTPDAETLRQEMNQYSSQQNNRQNAPERKTSRGTLQACVTLGKLRPGGLLVWAREEPLTSIEGKSNLQTLLDHARLLTEWDFSTLTGQHWHPGIPKFVYLFQRDPDVERRSTHHPLLMKISGKIKSHVEIPSILVASFSGKMVAKAEHWNIHLRRSPNSQASWTERWPDPTSEALIRKLEILKENSRPLGQFASIRAIPKPHQQEADRDWSTYLSSHFPAGILLECNRCSQTNRLRAVSFQGKQEAQSELSRCRLKAEFLVVFSNPKWTPTIAAYLESPIIRDWLDHFSEKSKSGWVLKEQSIRFLPIPQVLIQALENAETMNHRGDSQWTRMMNEVSNRPKLLEKTLKSIPLDAKTAPMRAALFVRVAEELERLRSSYRSLFQVINLHGSDHPFGMISWKAFLSVLPVKECIPFSMHPRVELHGSIPRHQAIVRIERLRGRQTGIELATEVGHRLMITAQNPIVLEMLWDQIQNLKHPTWSELIQSTYLPRDIEQAKASAQELISAHENQVRKKKNLVSLLETCSSF